ncbi:hypothetical protein KAR91_50860 [Candidatus Pacearchaeota archaeon]|nr:hypothetical protein [Candidatus Pacearchaeota archaeon]
MGDRIGRENKSSVTLWGDSWFNLLLAIHLSESQINARQTRLREVSCAKTEQNPLGERFIPESFQSNFWTVVAEIERQTELGPAIKEILAERRQQLQIEAQ